MDPFLTLNGVQPQETWRLGGLEPTPEAEWRRMQEFLSIDQAERAAMLATVEPLFRRGHELVVGTYDYLLYNQETAAILGWEKGADPAHLAERRRFFTVWLARLLGLDFSEDLARYLFRAGKMHAAHGPRRAHVPPLYVNGSISLVNATFARFLHEEMPGDPAVIPALAGWNKALSLHLHLMLLGYHAATALDQGPVAVPVTLFGKLRDLTGRRQFTVHLAEGDRLEQALRKVFNYYPEMRAAVCDTEWEPGERLDSHGTPWFAPAPVLRIKPMWRVLLNGKDISYNGGLSRPVAPGDELHFFPPGR